MPSAEARPVPTIMATGVARPMAHGHATSNTATPLSTAVPKFPSSSHHARKVTAAADQDDGDEDGTDPVGQLLQRGLVALGVFHQPLHAGQHRLRRDGVDPHHQRAGPVAGPSRDLLPGPWSTGRGSPVSIDSSTADQPLTTTPSRGMASLGRTRTSAPTGTLSGGDEVPFGVVGSDTTRAVGGRSAISECMARAARRRARASTARPVTRMAMMSGAMTPCRRAANSPPPPMCTWRPPRAIASTALTARAASVPTVINVSMLVAPWRSRRALSRKNGQPPANSTTTARTEHDPSRDGVLGAEQRHPQRDEGSGHEIAARRAQWSGSPWGRRRVVVARHRRRVADGAHRRAQVVGRGLGGGRR